VHTAHAHARTHIYTHTAHARTHIHTQHSTRTRTRRRHQYANIGMVSRPKSNTHTHTHRRHQYANVSMVSRPKSINFRSSRPQRMATMQDGSFNQFLDSTQSSQLDEQVCVLVCMCVCVCLSVHMHARAPHICYPLNLDHVHCSSRLFQLRFQAISAALLHVCAHTHTHTYTYTKAFNPTQAYLSSSFPGSEALILHQANDKYPRP